MAAETNTAGERSVVAELGVLAQIMRRVERLSPASKSWLYDRLAHELGIKEDGI